jgi:SAM-dependent methyltransferase
VNTTIEYFNENAERCFADAFTITERTNQDHFLSYITPGGTILDFGCGSGRDTAYFRERGYETEDDKLDAGKTTWFLKVVVGIVLSVGLLISALSFYILMLSIYLLLQKNTTKLENLLLIGYGPNRVALPYQVLTIGLNAVVLVLSVGIVLYVRTLYLDVVEKMFPALDAGGCWLMLVIGILLFVAVSFFNVVAVRKKVASIWMHQS